MAENTTDETVDYNSEDNNQGTNNPQQSRTGYSTVGELQKANYYNSIKKTPASLRPLFKAAMAGKLPVQQEQVKQTAKPAFSMKEVEAAAMAEIKPKAVTTGIQKPSVKPLVEKQEGPKLQKSKSNIDTYNDVLIAVDNQSKLYESQLPSDMPMKDIFVEQKKQDFLSRVKKGELRVSKDDKGFPVLKNVIDGVISNFIDGYQSTLNANSQVNEFDVMDKDEQISYMKGSRLKPMTTIGETGKPTKVRYTEEPINKDLNTIQTERRGIGAETSMMMGGVVPDIATGMVVQALPGIGQFLSPAVVGAVQGRRQQFDSMNQAFQTAKQRGLSDEDAYEVANNFWNSKVSLITGVAEGVVSQYLGNKILHKFAEAKPAADLKSFGQAAKAFLKDAASNSKDLALSGSLDGAVAYSMEKVRGGSDDSAEEQFKAEFLTQLGFAAVGGAVSVPKYVKSYAYNAISNLDNQTIYNNMVSMEQAGAVPEGTAKKVVEDIDKFRETKNKVAVSNPDAISTVAGLTIKAEAIQEQIKNTSPTNINTLTALNTELEQINQRINKAQSSVDPLSEEVDDKTGLNIKNKQNATTISQGQEVPTTGGVSQYQRTEGEQAPQTNEANNSYSAFGSQTQQQKIILNAQNAADAKIDRPKSLIDGLINSASNVISALKSISPNLNVLVIPTAEEYGNTLVQQELDNGESVSKQREKDLRGSNGAVNQEGDTIYINAENIAKKGKTSTIFHEGAHPIINAIVSNNPEALNTLYDQLSGLQGDIDGVDRVLAFGGGYSNYGIDVVQSEAIVEFIARVADGQIKLPVDNPTVMKNILDVIKGFLEIIGFPVDIQSIDDIQSIAAKIKEGFQTGREIVLSNVTGSATEAGITSDAIVINAASITATERGVDKSGLNLELTERNFDVNKIKYIDMADIDGANAFIFAADKAVSGLVKSPSGYVHEFNGGVTYSYQDGTGVWAFTSLDAATKFMNKVKTTDGVGLIMSQASSGIRGSYDFYTYMLGELNNAIEKGVSEKDLVTFLDSKLDIKVGDKSIREELANKGGKTTITSLADLDKLMPIDGPNLISYEYRGEFVQKSLSAFAEKNFGIPRFEKILEYANEPLITSAEYGDIVAAIQIDKNSPIIDTRKDNRFKNHTSYPFVVTGAPIGIFNKFYDVRKIAPNFVPVSGNQTPLAAREKPQAARSAMGGQPLVKISPALSLQVDNAIKVDKSSGTTQVATTTGSYTKAANIAKSLGAKSVLDYGAGLGLGSDAMSNVIKNVDSFEPNTDRWKGKKEPAFTSSADINKTYDAVVSLNVLNVVPKDIRDAIVKDIYNKLNPNGSAIISTRGWTGDVNQAKNAEKGPERKSAIIKRKEAGGTTDVYQKGFDGNELVDYVKDILGNNVEVKKDNSFGKSGVVITKKSGALQLQQDGSTRKSAKQTGKENNRTDADAIASLIYNTNATKRAQESIEKTSLIQKISNLYKNIRLAGIENQASVRDLFRKNGAPGALADALLTTSRGYGAQATLAAEDISETVYGGLSDKKKIDIAGTLVSEVDLLNQIMNQRRVVAVQNMVQEKFDELQSMRAQMKKLKSKAKKGALQIKIDAAVEYLQDRKVLGKKYNPQTQTSTEYLQNYQVGSTVDAAGNKVSYNAGFASKQLDIISREYDGFNDLNERADKMFNAYRGLVKEKLDEGLISKESYDYYTKHDYVPISYIDKILKENDPDYARVLSKNPNQIRKSILGGGADGDILTDYKSIFEVYAVNHYKNVSTNKAAKGLANFAETVDKNGEVELARPILDDEGNVKIDKEGNPVYRTPPEGKSYIYFYENGQKKALLASDNIANEWYAKYAQSNELNIISNLALAGVAQKLFTGKNPGFGIFQMIALDPITAAVSTDVFSKSMPIAYAQIALGGKDTVGWKGSIEEVVGRGDKYRLAAKWGAFTEMNAGKELETAITKVSNDESNGNAYEKILKNVNNITNKPIETLDKLMDATGLGKVSDVTEKATRLIIFDRARKTFTDKFVKDNGRQPNKSELDNIYTMSAAEARRSSDFSRGGSIIKPASRLLIYFNSTVQTNVSVINQARKNPARFAYQIGEMLTLGGLVTAYSAGLMSAPWETDDDKKKKKAAYKSLSEYQKLNYLNIYIGGDVPERQFLKVPIPPFFKNFWVSSMMAFENKYNKGMYTAKDYVASAASANPFGSIADMPSKIPPTLNALAAYNNIDIFTKKNIVQDEADLPDNLEGAMDDSISIFYKKMGEKTGLSPARTQAAMKKIIGEPERNPMIYIPKIAFESTMELATGAPLSIKDKFEKDWKGTLLNSLSLQKRVFAGTPKYYQTMVEGDLREISFLQSKAYASLMSSDSKAFDEYQSKIKEKKNAIVEYLKPIKESNPSIYDRMVKETESPIGGVKMDLTKSMSESTKRNYIQDNYDKNIYQAYIINDPKLRAKYIYDQVKDMSKEDKAHYFVILYNLGIANETNATGLEYNKLKKANQK